MRLFLAAFACLLSAGSLSAKLSPSAVTTAYAHLAEVNARWLEEASPETFLVDASFSDETARIRYHLREVHRLLSGRSVSRLSAKQTSARRAALAHLAAYAERGRFPINTAHPQRTPYFVDADGTHCAVGYLMHRAGDDALVDAIRARDNNGYVLRDLLEDPAVGAWAGTHGFTAEELAWIQPGYPGNYLLRPSAFGRGLGVRGGQVLAAAQTPDRTIYLAGDFTEVDGVPAAGLVAVRGSTLTAIAHDFGRITSVVPFRNTGLLMCTGAESTTGRTRLGLLDPATGTTVAHWDFEPDDRVYVQVDSLAFPLVFVGKMRQTTDLLRAYRINLASGQLATAAPEQAFTGTIHDSYYFDGRVTLGGAFSVATRSGSLVDSNQVTYDVALDRIMPDDNRLADRGWSRLTEVNLPVLYYYGVERQHLFDKRYASGEYLAYEPSSDTLHRQRFQIVVEDSDRTMEEGRGFGPGFSLRQSPDQLRAFARQGSLMLSGNLAPPGANPDPADATRLLATNYGLSFLFYTQEIPIDGLVMGVVQSGDSLLLAGDFTSVAGLDIQQLAWATPLVSDAPSPPPPQVRAYATSGQLHVELDEALDRDARLYLYDSAGRLLKTVTIAAGESIYRVELDLGTPVLHFALDTERGVGAGTVVDWG